MIKAIRQRSPRNRAVLPSLAALAALAVLVGPGAASAQSPEERGLEIAVEMDRRDLGWGDSATELTMVLSNSQGDTSTRQLRQQALEVDDPALGDRSLVIFDRPRDVEGTAFLSHTNILDADDQWLYLPALARVKRISSANKSGPFMGSEFAYEDLLSQEVEKYDFRWLRDEACGDLQCFLVERIPLYENSGYTRQLMWVDQEHYRPMRIEFFDRRDELLKTLTYHDYRQYLGQYWRAHELVMENHQTGKGTVLTFSDYEFQLGLSEGDFTSSRLRRAR